VAATSEAGDVLLPPLLTKNYEVAYINGGLFLELMIMGQLTSPKL